MSNQPAYNPYYDQQKPPGNDQYPPVGGQFPPLAGQYQQSGAPPPPYGVQQPPYGGNPQQPPPMFPPPVHHTGFADQPNMSGGQDHDMEANLFKPNTLQFDNKSVRAGFIRKVFMLLTVMLLIVFSLTMLFSLHKGVKDFVRANPGLYWASYGIFLVSYLCIVCCESVRRKFPGNLICLLALTLSMGYMTAMISAYYDIESVFLAMGICAACCFSIILFSSQTKYDFTSWIGVMFVISMVLFLFGIIAIFFAIYNQSRILYVVYAGIAALVFMVYLAIDTQMVIGGKRYEYSPEDYIMAAVQLFLDIIYIFIYLLQIIGYAKNN